MENNFPIDVFNNRPRSAPERTLGADFGRENIKQFFLGDGASMEFAESFAHILSTENEKKIMEKILNNVASSSNDLLSSKVSALDVQMVVSTTQQIKDDIINHFKGYQIKFKEPGPNTAVNLIVVTLLLTRGIFLVVIGTTSVLIDHMPTLLMIKVLSCGWC